MKPSCISHCDRITSHYLKAANTMTLPTSQKTTRETALLYGAWTILILSMLAMVLPISNSRSALGSADIDMTEAINAEVTPR